MGSLTLVGIDLADQLFKQFVLTVLACHELSQQTADFRIAGTGSGATGGW